MRPESFLLASRSAVDALAYVPRPQTFSGVTGFWIKRPCLSGTGLIIAIGFDHFERVAADSDFLGLHGLGHFAHKSIRHMPSAQIAPRGHRPVQSGVQTRDWPSSGHFALDSLFRACGPARSACCAVMSISTERNPAMFAATKGGNCRQSSARACCFRAGDNRHHGGSSWKNHYGS